MNKFAVCIVSIDEYLNQLMIDFVFLINQLHVLTVMDLVSTGKITLDYIIIFLFSICTRSEYKEVTFNLSIHHKYFFYSCYIYRTDNVDKIHFDCISMLNCTELNQNYLPISLLRHIYISIKISYSKKERVVCCVSMIIVEIFLLFFFLIIRATSFALLAFSEKNLI